MNSQHKQIAEWVDSYTEDMYTWASYKLSDEELARDMVQETFLIAYEKLHSFKGKSSPKTWLYSILNYKIIDVYRKNSRKTTPHEMDTLENFFDEKGEWIKAERPEDWEEEKNLLDNADFQNILKKCLDALPEKWNACVKFKYLMDVSSEKICQELEITPANFWQIMHRAKLNLRDCVDKNWFKI
ncbi:MAG: sigma-70 family RNA polymerase sigma factor [Bacteroidota bacterium]|nr:sigma-70 family RNA polymerase sigma factor [Bacteroidota bacterium]